MADLQRTTVKCSRCNGTGELGGDTCYKCMGVGFFRIYYDPKPNHMRVLEVMAIIIQKSGNRNKMCTIGQIAKITHYLEEDILRIISDFNRYGYMRYFEKEGSDTFYGISKLGWKQFDSYKEVSATKEEQDN